MLPFDRTPPLGLTKRKVSSDGDGGLDRFPQRPRLDIAVTIAQYEQCVEAHRDLQQEIKSAFCTLQSFYSSNLVWLNFVDRAASPQHVHDLIATMRDELAGAQPWLEAVSSESSSRAASMLEKMTALREALLRDSTWYLRGNLLSSFSVKDIEQIFPNMDTGNGQDFHEYLRSLMPTERQPDARRKIDIKNERRRFADQVFALAKLLLKSNRPSTTYHYFHTLVLFASKAFRPDHGSPKVDDWKNSMYSVTSHVQQCFSKPFEPVDRFTDKVGADIRPRYWDLARAGRELSSTWQELECRQYVLRGWNEEHCWHSKCRTLFRCIQKHAYGEIRSKVFLVVGGRLPTELKEQIFEFAMIAEKVQVLRGDYEGRMDMRPPDRCRIRPRRQPYPGMDPYPCSNDKCTADSRLAASSTVL